MESEGSLDLYDTPEELKNVMYEYISNFDFYEKHYEHFSEIPV